MIPRNDQDVVRLYREGLSCQQIGLIYGVSRVAISCQLKRLGVETRPSAQPRYPMFDIVMLRAHGWTMLAIGQGLGCTHTAIHHRLRRIEALGDLTVLITLSQEQAIEYREALDVDRLSHPDALEVALEYRMRAAA